MTTYRLTPHSEDVAERTVTIGWDPFLGTFTLTVLDTFPADTCAICGGGGEVAEPGVHPHDPYLRTWTCDECDGHGDGIPGEHTLVAVGTSAAEITDPTDLLILAARYAEIPAGLTDTLTRDRAHSPALAAA